MARAQASFFDFMFLFVMLVRLSYYYVIFLHFDRSDERRDRAKISLVSQYDFQQSQVFFFLSPA